MVRLTRLINIENDLSKIKELEQQRHLCEVLSWKDYKSLHR